VMSVAKQSWSRATMLLYIFSLLPEVTVVGCILPGHMVSIDLLTVPQFVESRCYVEAMDR
jgi:hypothetical protein